ncbi:MAG TPA: kelch repeat-containing protein [Solirubrobacter sp.]
MRTVVVLVVLVVLAARAPAAGAVLPSVAPGFATSGLMNLTHAQHTATLLLDGRVLVTGGWGETEGRSAELYDPATDTWTPGPDMATPRVYATATRLLDGRVLVVGGVSPLDGTTSLGTSEIYNPATNKWSPPASIQFPRWAHTATLMADGKVVIVGGIATNNAPVAVAERYDPAINAWSQAGTLGQARWAHSAVRLPNGKLFISSGHSSQGSYTSSELYNPATNTWSPAAATPHQRSWGHAELLANGKVLVVGRVGVQELPTTADLYDPVANAWSPAGALAVTRNQFSTVLLPDGRVGVFGGSGPTTGAGIGSAEAYDPASNTWSALDGLGFPRWDAQAVVLADGRVLFSGGGNGASLLANADLFTSPTILSAPARVALGEQAIGTSTTSSVTLTNAGVVPLLVADPEIGGRNAPEYAITGNTCTRTAGVAPGASCSLTVAFTPGTPGPREGTLTFQSNAAVARRSIALDGTGTIPPAPIVEIPKIDATPTPAPATTPRAVAPAAARSATVTIHFEGGYTLPPGVSRGRACRGSISLTLKRGNHVLVRRTVNLDRRCRFKATFKVRRTTLKNARRLTVVQRFNGNRTLGARTDRVPVKVP